MVATLRMPSRNRIAPGAERRIFPRKVLHTPVQGVRLDHSINARQHPHVSLDLRDLSLGGCSAISPNSLEQGERVNIYFPPRETTRGWDAYGRVIRCEPSGMGYRVAVEFDPLPAA